MRRREKMEKESGFGLKFIETARLFCVAQEMNGLHDECTGVDYIILL